MTYSKSKLLGLPALLRILPVITACNPNAAEAPLETTPEVSEAPTTSDPTITDPAMEPTAGSETIAEVAATNPSLSTFNTALESAGLVDALNEPSLYTVFAPSNKAFEALPSETLQQLLAPENMV